MKSDRSVVVLHHFGLGRTIGFQAAVSIGGGRGQRLGGTMANAQHEPITGVWGQSSWSVGQGFAPLKLKAFWSLDVQRSRQI